MKTKLTEEDYEEIRESYYAGESKADIARRKNISKYYVDGIINGQKGVMHYYKQEAGTRRPDYIPDDCRNTEKFKGRRQSDCQCGRGRKWLYKKTYPQMPGKRKVQTDFYGAGWSMRAIFQIR